MNSLQGLEKNATATYLSNVRIIVQSHSKQTFAIQSSNYYSPISEMKFSHILDPRDSGRTPKMAMLLTTLEFSGEVKV